MKLLVFLLIVFAIALLAIKIIFHKYEIALSARIAMSAMLVVTAIGHFAYTRGMKLMIPGFIPFKTEIVYLTGIIEIMAAIGLLIPQFRVLSAWLLILFFVLLLPANIKAAIEHVNFEKGTYDGKGLNYLWTRIPLQIIFIIWTYLSSIRF
jgi:uncharacterized membrane protein